MAKFTFLGVWAKDRKTRIFATGWDDYLFISSFADGIAVAEPDSWLTFGSFLDYADIITGCFEEESNFKDVLLESYGLSKDTHFHGIRFIYDNVLIFVTKENADKDKLYQFWKAERDAIQEREKELEEI